MNIYPDCSIKLSGRKNRNVVNIDGKNFQLKYLNDKIESNKGGNSNIFLLYDPQTESEELVIKFCKYDLFKDNQSNRPKRFIREIASLRRAKNSKLNKVISLISYGKLVVQDWKTKRDYKFYYHITEKAESDLTDFIKSGFLMNEIQTKIQLCIDLIISLKQLHSINIYHRDIKPENILFFQDGSWKLCDLGLVEFRDIEVNMDKPNDMIGPRGWLSPESCNKHYSFGQEGKDEYLCVIDEKSDLFQLGKIFWFIFQSNIPIGRIHRKDFLIPDDNIYAFLMWMLRHDKRSRLNMVRLETEFRNVVKKYYKIKY